MNNTIQTIDHIFQKYGQPLTNAWHQYAVVKTIGMVTGLLILVTVCFISTKYIIKGYKSSKDLNTLFADYRIWVASTVLLMSGLIIMTISPGIIPAILTPDIYWLVNIISK